MARQPRRVPSKSRPAVAAGAADTIPSRPAVQHVVTDPRRVAARSTARGTRGPEALTPRGAARVERERAAGAGPTWVRASRWRLVGDAPC
ncbi:MAG: hypothetical protein HY906_04960, partial [Deltaproteobacteria bacterium]|nr:hypothetical protein [Deltaproteobacteria bacterium]